MSRTKKEFSLVKMKNIKKVPPNGILPQSKCRTTFESCGQKMVLCLIYFTAALMGKAKLSPSVWAVRCFSLTRSWFLLQDSDLKAREVSEAPGTVTKRTCILTQPC